MIIVIKGYLKGGKLLRIYDRIKREHLFVFLVLLSALIVFNSFDDQFGYTGLTVGVANNYVTGNSFIDTIGKYIKNPFTTKGAIPKVSCDYNGPDEVIIPLCSANPSCWWDSDSGLCRSTESTDVGAIPTEIPLSVILDKRSMLPGETVTLTASNNIGILTWEVLTTDTCRFEATGNRIISGINNARITSIVSGICSVSVHDTREAYIGQVIKEINIRPQGSTVEAPTTVQSCNDKYNIGNKGTLVNTQSACDADSICEWNGITNTCMEKGGLITITSDKTGILNIGDLAYLNARSQGVSSFRWIILNYNPQNPVCVIVHHGTEDGGPYVNYGIPLRAKNPGICQVSVRDDRSTDPITYVAVYTFSVQNLQQTSIEIVAPSNLQARLSNNNVILSWNLGDVINTVTTGAVYENQITGNAGFFDSIANFFRNLFGIGTRGALLTQQNIVYDVWRKEAGGSYEAITRGLNCPTNQPTCSYTDTSAQQGKTYYYKVGVRPSTEVFSSTSVKFSNEASIAIPAAAQLPVGQRACSQLTENECATQSSRCELAQGPTSVMICRDKTTTQPACGSITDIYVCSDNDDRCIWDTTTNNCADKTTEQPSGQPASLGVNVAPNVAVGGRVTATISGGTPTYRVAPLLGYGSVCRIVVPTPNADGTAFVGGTTFTIEGLADGSCMIRVTDNASPARFKDVSISVGSEQVIPVEQRVCSQLTESECATQSSRCEWVQGPTSAMLCRDKVVTTLEICDNNVDDDGDHVIDKLDKDCTGSYVNIASIVPPTRDALVGTDVDFVCKVTLGGQTTDYNNALQYCVDGKIAETNCNTKSLLSNGVLFENCNVGNSAKANQTITCFIDSACNAPPNSALGNATLTASFNVVDVDFCSEGVKGDGLDIRNFDIDKSKYKIGDDIEIDVKIKSLLETRDVNVEVILYDLTDRDVVVDNEQSAEIKRSSTEDFVFKLAIPGSVDEDNKYRIYVKVSEDRNEDEQCKLDSKSLKIEGTGCVDKDKDGSCTPADCNDSNANVYPTAAEICSDAIDNNCNGLVDSQDS